MSEADLLEEAIKLCDKYNLLYFHSYDSRRDKMKGYPDLTILGTSLIFAELKSGITSLRTEQVVWKYKLLAAGQKHYVWTPYELESGEIDRVLSGL